VTPPHDQLSTICAMHPHPPVAGCDHPTVHAKVIPMYQVSVTVGATPIEQIPCDDLDMAVEVLRAKLTTAVAPGRRISWVIRCPTGRVVRGDITINTTSADPRGAVADHVVYVRDVLIGEHRSSTDPLPLNGQVSARMSMKKAAKAALVTVGVLAGVAAALIVLSFAAVILVVLLGLWVCGQGCRRCLPVDALNQDRTAAIDQNAPSSSTKWLTVGPSSRARLSVSGPWSVSLRPRPTAPSSQRYSVIVSPQENRWVS